MRKANEIKSRLASREANIEIVQTLSIPRVSDIQSTSPNRYLRESRRPLCIGASVSHIDDYAGTLGAFVEDDGDDICILSNSHVLAKNGVARRGERTIQPGHPDLEPEGIGTLRRGIVISQAAKTQVDAAYASLDKGIEYEGNRVPEQFSRRLMAREIDQPSSQEEIDQLIGENRTVLKIGRTTGRTEGVVSAVGVMGVPIDYGPLGIVSLHNLIEVQPSKNNKLRRFTRPGDSGSLVFLKHSMKAIGLHFAGGVRVPPEDRRRQVHVSYSCNILDVFGSLGVSMV